MSRYSPTVTPQPRSGLASALGGFAHGFQDQRERRRRQEREDELDERYEREFDFRRERAKTQDQRYEADTRRRETRDQLERHERGYREGEAPVDYERRAPGIDLGTAPGGFAEGERPTDLMHRHGGGFQRGPDATLGGERGPLAAELDGLALEGPPAEPELVALPGAFVPGHPEGFTDRALYRQRPRTPLNAFEEHPDPRYEQVTDDIYRDRTATPEARSAAAEEAEQREQAELLGALENVTPEQARALAAGAPVSAVLPRERAGADPYGGRSRDQYFEDLDREQGIRARHRDTDDGSGGVSPTQLAVAERQRVLNAARDVSRVDPNDFYGSDGQQRYEQQIQRTLQLYGLGSIDELSERMRSMGIPQAEAGSGGAGAGAGAGPEGESETPNWRERAAELREQGATEDEIVGTLREEGLIR